MHLTLLLMLRLSRLGRLPFQFGINSEITVTILSPRKPVPSQPTFSPLSVRLLL
jgi:hypothetical protein